MDPELALLRRRRRDDARRPKSLLSSTIDASSDMPWCVLRDRERERRRDDDGVVERWWRRGRDFECRECERCSTSASTASGGAAAAAIDGRRLLVPMRASTSSTSIVLPPLGDSGGCVALPCTSLTAASIASDTALMVMPTSLTIMRPLAFLAFHLLPLSAPVS
jgi:hypothetical protein